MSFVQRSQPDHEDRAEADQPKRRTPYKNDRIKIPQAATAPKGEQDDLLWDDPLLGLLIGKNREVSRDKA